ncbi:MAG: hydroxyisourate hydrolase [Xanthomonadales bacterium]|nr:hydroxyisourate hydrolase [Xanthomonadales bacterium]
MSHELVIFVQDSLRGRPAEGLAVEVTFCDANGSRLVPAERRTARDGCCRLAWPRSAVRCRAEVRAAEYWKSSELTATFGQPVLDFSKTPGDQTVICLLISPHGYTSYRGYA